MSYTVTFGGTNYELPSAEETNWSGMLKTFFAALVAGASSTLVFGNRTTPANTSTNFLVPGNSDSVADTTERYVRAPRAGYIRAMYVQATTGPVTQGQTVTLRVNGSDIGSVALAAAATQANGTFTQAIAAGDRISLKLVGTAGIATGAVNLVVSLSFTEG